MTSDVELAPVESKSAFDPLAPEFIEDPHRVLDEVRSTCPIAHSDQFGGFWALTRRRDVVEAAKRSDDFINSVLHIVSGRKKGAGHTRPLMHSDQPEHTWFRAAMVPVLGGPIGKEIVPDMEAEAERLVREVVGAGETDLVRSFAGPLMGYAITRIFSIDHVTAAEFDKYARQYVEGGQINDDDMVQEAHAALYGYAADIVEDRRKHPRDPERDLATALVQATTPAGEPLDPEKIVGAIRQPFLIVWLATSHSLGNMLQRLLLDQELQRTLRANPELISASVEEFLRMDMPQLGFGRTTTHDMEFGGAELKEGDAVALVFPSANRDPEVFENPNEFRIGRSPNPHLTFGAGIHSCPGKGIARDLIRIALEAIITGTGALEVAGPIDKECWPFRAPLTLPTKVTAPAAGAAGEDK